MTPTQKKLARHALGLTNPKANGETYRNRFICTPADNYYEWRILEEAGLATRKPFAAGDIVFMLTRAGAELALDPGESLDPEDFPPASTQSEVANA